MCVSSNIANSDSIDYSCNDCSSTYLDKYSETFPIDVVHIIKDMSHHMARYAWAPMILAQLYHDLFQFNTQHQGGQTITHDS